MALFCACVDADVIKLVGCWPSDEMLCYLHLQAYPQMHTFAAHMVSGGTFHLLNHQPLPDAAHQILEAAVLPPVPPTP